MKKQDYVYEVCKVGRGNKCCRYLTVGANGFECAKINSPDLISILDIKSKTKIIIACGDNCNGKDLVNMKEIFLDNLL